VRVFARRNQRLVLNQRDNDLFAGIGSHNGQGLIGNRFGLVPAGKLVAFSDQDYNIVLGQEDGLAIVFLQISEKNEAGQGALERHRLNDRRRCSDNRRLNDSHRWKRRRLDGYRLLLHHHDFIHKNRPEDIAAVALESGLFTLQQIQSQGTLITSCSGRCRRLRRIRCRGCCCFYCRLCLAWRILQPADRFLARGGHKTPDHRKNQNYQENEEGQLLTVHAPSFPCR